MIKTLRFILPEFQIIHIMVRSMFMRLQQSKEVSYPIEYSEEKVSKKTSRKSNKKGRILDA